MKKIAAFITAAMLFCIVAVAIHQIAGGKIEANNLEFGTWINSKKDLSYSAIKSNIQEDTVMMMGSSEFQYGKNTPYHPTSIFRNANMNVMCIGAAKNQCLSHAITMAAVAPELKNKKAILILSPTWFSKEGIDGSGFSARFSESLYTAMLKNDGLSEELKEKLVDRSKTLLEVSPSMKENVDRDTKIISEDKGNLEDKINYYMHRWLANERERLSVGLMWKISGNKNNKEYKNDGKVSPPDWDSLAEQADEEFFKSCSNEFYMSDKMFKKKIKPIMETKKNSQANRTFDDSPEYDDLKLFLDVCNNQGVDVMLVMLPVSGYWYDYTGFPKENRKVVEDKVGEIAADKGAEFCSFFDKGYTKGWLTDHVHPAGKGWVEINEKAYEFFNKD